MADVLNAELLALGIARVELRAIADTRADGSGVVRLKGTPQGAWKLARVLRRLRPGDGRDAA